MSGEFKRITFLLAEAGIEIPPPEIRSHPAILSDAKRRGRKPDEILLYVSKHKFAIDKLNNSIKRGRPDITHKSLLLLLDSVLNKRGLLRILIHTVNNEIIEVSPETRLPRDYYQFEGLMVQLLKYGRVPLKNSPLIWRTKYKLNEILSENFIILLSEKGEKINLKEIGNFLKRNPVFIVGAFQKGDFSEIFYRKSNLIIRISEYPLTTLSVICRTLTIIELALNLLQ